MTILCNKSFFPPGFTFLALVFWTFLAHFSDPTRYLEEFASPQLIRKKIKFLYRFRQGSNPRPFAPQSNALTIRPRGRSLQTMNFRFILFYKVRYRKSIHAINGSGNLYKIHEKSRNLARKVKQGEKTPFLFRFLMKNRRNSFLTQKTVKNRYSWQI